MRPPNRAELIHRWTLKQLAARRAYAEHMAELERPKHAKRVVKPCGTIAAWRRHHRRNEPVCDECRAARYAYDQEMKAQRKAAA